MQRQTTFCKKDVTNSVRIYDGEISHRWKESLRNYCKLAKSLPNNSETDTTRICRMFVPLTKQTFVKWNESEVCFPATLLYNWFDVKSRKKSWKNQVIAREALVDCGKKIRVLSTKGDSVTNKIFLPSSLWSYLLLQICKQDRIILRGSIFFCKNASFTIFRRENLLNWENKKQKQKQ